MTEITGGVGGLCKLIKYYSEDISSKFRAPRAKYPIIILVDNDSGGKNVFGAIAGITGAAKPSGTEPFIHVIGNLYVVATPLLGKKESMIEDFFDDDTLSEKLNGKTFNPAKDADNATNYGKSAFARDVVAKNASTIDFSKFSEILDRISDVIADYTAKHPTSPTLIT